MQLLKGIEYKLELGLTNASSFHVKVRVPVGRLILELPAGMLDDDKGDFLGTAVREVSVSFAFSTSVLYFFLNHIQVSFAPAPIKVKQTGIIDKILVFYLFYGRRSSN